MQARQAVGMFLLGLLLAFMGPLWVISVFSRRDAPDRPGDAPVARRFPRESPRYGRTAIYLFSATFFVGGLVLALVGIGMMG